MTAATPPTTPPTPAITRRQALAKATEFSNTVASLDDSIKRVDGVTQIKVYNPNIGELVYFIATAEAKNSLRGTLSVLRDQADAKAQENMALAAEAEAL